MEKKNFALQIMYSVIHQLILIGYHLEAGFIAFGCGGFIAFGCGSFTTAFGTGRHRYIFLGTWVAI
jgi:hypothetical protein